MQFAGGALHVVREPHLLDQAELFLDEVDVLLFALLNLDEELARDEILDRFAVCDCRLVHRVGGHLALQIAFEDLPHILADEELSQVLQIGQAVQKQDALDQPVRVAHFVDGLVVFDLAQPPHAPVVEHAGVQKILVDGGELVLERLIEEVQDFGVSLHGAL